MTPDLAANYILAQTWNAAGRPPIANLKPLFTFHVDGSIESHLWGNKC
jgi:hypothetical protein